MNRTTIFVLLGLSLALSGCIVAAPTPQIIVVTATAAPSATKAPTAVPPTATPRPLHQSRATFDPGSSWERSSWLDSTCASNQNECAAWVFEDQELVGAVYDDGIGFTITLQGTGDIDKESYALQAAASRYGVSDKAILAAVDSAANYSQDTQFVGDWGWSVTISDEYLTIVFIFGLDVIDSGSSGGAPADQVQG
ncbi:MAG TPA: hypothetical protein VJK02_21210 [Anaerolineales bacterium]|nr:hypothetical protein [Anaerolineales bacterium]